MLPTPALFAATYLKKVQRDGAQKTACWIAASSEAGFWIQVWVQKSQDTLSPTERINEPQETWVRSTSILQMLNNFVCRRKNEKYARTPQALLASNFNSIWRCLQLYIWGENLQLHTPVVWPCEAWAGNQKPAFYSFRQIVNCSSATNNHTFYISLVFINMSLWCINFLLSR